MEALTVKSPLVQLVPRPRRSRAAVAWWALVLAACSAWSAVMLAMATGNADELLRFYGWLLVFTPVSCLLLVLVSRPHSPPYLKLALVWTTTLSLSLESVGQVYGTPLVVAVPLAMACAAAFAWRWPLFTLIAAFALSGLFNVLEAFTPVEAGPASDLALGGAWLALVFAWLSGHRPLPRGVSPALLLFGAYIAATLAAGLVAEDLTRSMYSFRQSAWLMTAVLLVPFLVSEDQRWRLLQRGALVGGALVGAYSLFRWGFGQSGTETAQLKENPTYVSTDLGDFRLIGSLPTPQALSVWCSAMVPFALASALTPIGGLWRLVAFFAAGTCGAALFGADVRFGMVAAAAGGLTVLIMFAVGRGFAGRRALPLAVVGVLAAVGVSIFVATKLDAEGESGERFTNLITNPIADNSVQGRLVKWETILAEGGDRPFGRGLGASGAAEFKYARFSTAASFDPDSSFVKIAYDQGFLVLALFGVGLAGLAIALGRRTLEALDPVAAGVALGGLGALVAFTVDMSGAVYFEGLLALAPWMLVGLGFAPFMGSASDDAGEG